MLSYLKRSAPSAPLRPLREIKNQQEFYISKNKKASRRLAECFLFYSKK